MSKHTPGPWHVGQGNGKGLVFSDQGRMRMELGGTTLYPICKVQTGWDEGEDKANARLIAAAPELLSVLAEFVLDIESAYPDLDDLSDDWPDLHTTFAQARAAIAKAKGGTP